MKKSYRNDYFLLFLILVLALILRFGNLTARFPFSGEIGSNLLDIKNYILAKEIPLIGPPTSHPWLSFGPLYYWMMIPIMLAFKFNPLAPAYTGAILGGLIVLANFVVVKKVFSQKIALISSLLISLSPLFILFSQASRFYFFTVLFFYLLLYSLNSFWQGKVKQLFLVGFSFGLMLNFHYSSLILLPVLILILSIRKKKLAFRNYLNLFLGFLIPNIPLLIYDFKNDFLMLKQFLIWIPYRILGFIGLIPKNTVSGDSVYQSLLSFVQLFGQSISSDKIVWLIITGVILGILGYKIKTQKINISGFPGLFLIGALFFSLLAIVVHGGAPLHYLLPIFPIPIILISKILSDLIKTDRVYIYLFIFLLLVNFNFYRRILIYKKLYISLNPNFVSYGIQKNVASAIVDDANYEEFNLKRVGPNDYFEENYSQNYRYLLWYMGNEPTENAKLKYTIYEDVSKLPKTDNLKAIWVDGIAIVKS